MTDHYAVIGNPIRQSKSPEIHTAFAASTDQDIHYDRIEATDFATAADAFRATGGRGLNITAPFKLDAFRYATDRSDAAAQAGAVNCLRFSGDRAEAQNFDGVGLLRDVEHNLGTTMRGRRVLLLGAGGAVRGAIMPFLGASPAELVVANRTRAKADTLRTEFGGFIACGLDDLSDAGPFDLVLNGTSSSLYGEGLPIPASVFGPDCLAYDMSYGKGLTPFLRLAQSATTRLHDGVGMLVEQAAEAFAWWRGTRPATAAVIERMTIPL